MADPDSLRPSLTEPLTAVELDRINRWPVGVLAGAGMAAGADSSMAIARAQKLIDEYGTSRRIDAEHAGQLLRTMRAWATRA
jgi:hypothetical protein